MKGMLLVGLLLCGGCASSSFNQDLTEGKSYGFLRNHHAKKTEVREVLNPDGTIKERLTTTMEVGTESTTADIMLGANELLGTAAGVAEKFKP